MNNNQRMAQCPNFQTCSAPQCVLDEFNRIRLKGEKRCNFNINSRTKSEKRVRTRLPGHLIKVILKKNHKMLSTSNQELIEGQSND